MYQIAIYKTTEPNFVEQQQHYALCRIIQSFGTEWYEAQATVRILRYVDSCDEWTQQGYLKSLTSGKSGEAQRADSSS
jgi:hypothetical protein